MLKQPIPIADFLGSLPLFEELDPGVLKRLLVGMSTFDAPRGTIFLRRGDLCTGFYAVIYGQVKLSLQATRGDEKVFELLARGDTFGESRMFLDEPNRYTAECLADSKLLHVAKNVVCAEIDHDAAFARRIIASLSRRLSSVIGDLEGCTLHSGTQRVVFYLLRLVRDQHEPENEATAVTLPAQKSIIASHLNVTHEHFSRILHELTAARLIEVKGATVRILDCAALRQHATA